MKKIFQAFITIIFLVNIYNCSGYKPIFGSSDIEFIIADYSIGGNEQISNQIYSKLENISKFNKNNVNAKQISLLVNSNKNKQATSKSATGEVLKYKIDLTTNIEIKDFLDNNAIINQDFNYSLTYSVQDQYSDTLRSEKKAINNLVNKTYEEIIVKLSYVLSK